MTPKTSLNGFSVKLACAAALTLAASALGANPPYSAAVINDGALGYYRFGDSLTRDNVYVNSGSLGAAGNATNTYNVHAFPGAIAGDGDRSQFFDTATSYAMIPYDAAMNPDNTKPFTLEAWYYPASDQINGGQCTLNNRRSQGVTDRTGWVVFQRAPNDSYNGKPGFEGVGWNFRMYRGSGSSSGLDVVSQVPYEVGKWTHVVVVYDPVDPVANASLTIYVNGVAANTNVWNSGTDPGYVANPAGSDAALSLGAYNNTSGAGGNPYFGAIDEFAFYSAKLTPAQILAHYQNGTNASRTVAYDALIKADNPVTYLRLNELPTGGKTALNMGDLRAAGVATHTAEVRLSAPSALAGRSEDSAAAYHNRNGNSTTTLPYLAENNPDSFVPFTFEAWLRPIKDQQGGQCAVNNRWVGGTGRTGWVIFQRNPNLTYPASEGHGWVFRMFTGDGTGGQDVLTDTDYEIGKWSHLVVTWEPYGDNGDPAVNGNHQSVGTLTAYFNGVAVASNPQALYAANRAVTETGSAAADLAIGSYNAASTLGNNPFEGDVDEVAIYNNYVLTPDQILAHYMAGTNAHPATNYETLVLMAANDGSGTQRSMPKTYLRFAEPAPFPAANSGSLGIAADGALVVATNSAAGPGTAGFGTANAAVGVGNSKGWVSLNHPAGLQISGQITLEAWIKPDANQGTTARIISHGPPTPTFVNLDLNPDVVLTGPLVSSNEIFLRIEGAGADYSVGSSDGTTVHGAKAAVTAGDLGGGNGWIYLVGTYDGSNWRLFRNGAQIAIAADTVGALPVNGADWAIGSTGNGWTDYFAGAIDEVAVYGVALTPAQVQNHYSVAQSSDVRLTIEKSGSSYLIRYPAGTLQQSDAVSGTYNNVDGASSPYTIPAGTTIKFYRVKL